MKVLSRLFIALAICLIAIPVMATSVQAGGTPDPHIRVTPSSGHPGDTVTVKGYEFDEDEDVDIYYYITGSTKEEVATDEADDEGEFTVTFTVPDSCSGKHKVRADGQYNDAHDDFTVKPGLELDPEDGSVGTEVTLKGVGFDYKEEDIEVRYYLDSSNYKKVKSGITANKYGTWTTTFEIPASDKGSHKIDAEGDDSSLGDVEDVSFEVEPGISLSPDEGYVGDTITVTGGGFKDKESGITVTYDKEQMGSSTSADGNGAWTISFEIPASIKGTHKIDASGNSTTASDIRDKNFTVLPKVTLSPETTADSPGSVGTSLTVTGSGFPKSKAITVTYDGAEKGTATTTATGSFSGISFEATHTQAAHTVEHPVEVTYDSTSISTNFFVESTAPPLPTLISPIEGSKAGFIGWKFKPTFEWAAVIDESGISHYALEIADNEEFTDAILVSAAGADLTVDTESDTVSYKLPKDKALPYGDYYWKVKAVDGAQNESEWSATQSFKAGFLPLWASIVIIILIVVLIGAVVYFFTRRKGYYD